MKIAQVIKEGGGWGNLDPSIIKKGVGGREGALIRLATEWAKLGHEVTNFVPTEKAIRVTETRPPGRPKSPDATPALWRNIGFHEYIPASLAKPMMRNFPYDAVVAWECPSVFADDDIVEKQKIRLVHMQVAHLAEQAYAEQFSTGVVALSEWAKDFLIHDGLSMESSKMYVRPNGVNISDYPIREKKTPKNFTMVYSSSPDRGLVHLLKIWPEIMKAHKNKARLFVAYGVSNFTDQIRWSHNKIGEVSVEIEILMQQPGVIDIGRIGQDKLANLQMKSSMWIYPADTIQATETGCITAIENMAAGNLCVISDADCLESEFGKSFLNLGGQECAPPGIILPLPFDASRWVEVINVLHENDSYEVKRFFARAFAETRSWSKIAPTWIDLFKELNAKG